MGDGFSVDVNNSVMWNEEIFKKYLKEVILRRYQTSMLKQPVILMVDSYPVHKKVTKELKDDFERIRTHLRGLLNG